MPGGGGGAEPRTGPAAGSPRPQPSARGGPAVGGGLGCPGVPRPRSAAPCVSLPRRRRSLIRARRLQRRLQRRCAKPGRSGAGGGTAEGEWTQVRRPRPAGGTALRRPGRGPLATARCDRIPPRAPREGLSVTHSCPPFSPLHLPKRPHPSLRLTDDRMPSAAGGCPRWATPERCQGAPPPRPVCLPLVFGKQAGFLFFFFFLLGEGARVLGVGAGRNPTPTPRSSANDCFFPTFPSGEPPRSAVSGKTVQDS